MMYQRPGSSREAPLPIAGHPRIQARLKFRDNIQTQGYVGTCNVDCIQGFKLCWQGNARPAILSYCTVHDMVGTANDTLKGIFLAAHQSHELYPGGSVVCYDQQFYMEKLFRLHELLQCQFCGLKFLSENDRNDHTVGYHMHRELG